MAFDMSALERGHLKVNLLDIRNHVLDIGAVFKCSVNSSQLQVGELFIAAIHRYTRAIIVVHEHPRGDPAPNPEDVTLTSAIGQAGKLLDVDILDHRIIGQGESGWFSMKERGLGFA